MCISKRICRGSFSLSVLPTFLLADEHLEKEFDTVCTLYSAPLRATLNIGTLWRCWNSEWTLARQGDLGHHFCKFGKQRLLTACTSGFTLKVHFQEKTTKREARKTLLLVALWLSESDETLCWKFSWDECCVVCRQYMLACTVLLREVGKHLKHVPNLRYADTNAGGSANCEHLVPLQGFFSSFKTSVFAFCLFGPNQLCVQCRSRWFRHQKKNGSKTCGSNHF